jgi:hypothetical protein
MKHFYSHNIFVFILLFVASGLCAQTFRVTESKAHKLRSFKADTLPAGYDAQLLHLERPLPDGPSLKSHIMRQKIESRKRFPLKKAATPKNLQQNTPAPLIKESWPMTRIVGNGIEQNVNGGIPNDNTLAISDSGIVLAAYNSGMYAWNVKDSTRIFSNNTKSLSVFANMGAGNSYYDPKLIYDKEADRFILVFLKNFDPITNGYVVCFSASNDPNGIWHAYFIEGNPLNNNRWTDFPAISITKEELFITGNLIVPDVSWQEGFDGSIIWQVDKNAGYAGDSILPKRLYSDIRYNGRFIRNLYPVPGAFGSVDNQYFLSNRNFDVQNDTVFVLKMNSLLTQEPALDIKALRTNLPYGMPPNGRQADTDPTDPTGGLQTNDARVLAGVYYDEKIQYVANCVHPETGLSCIYHGFVQNPGGNAEISGRYIYDEELDFGYPNIALCGNETCEPEALIGFNYTSPDSFPGIAAVYFANDSSYSDVQIIRTGLNYVDRLPDTYERWGDYFGLQRWHKNKNQAALVGYYALETRVNGCWLALLQSPDSSKLNVSITASESGNETCRSSLQASISGGLAPYTIFWNGIAGGPSISGLCNDAQVELEVQDARGCSEKQSYTYAATNTAEGLFPNPTSDFFSVRFMLEEDGNVEASLYDLGGRKVASLLQTKGKKGLNELNFSLAPLAQGLYIVKISNNDKELVSEKVMKR